MRRLACSGAVALLLGLGLFATARAQDHGEEPPAEHGATAEPGQGEHGATAEPGQGEHGATAEGGHGAGAHHEVAPLNFAGFGEATIPLIAMLFNFAVLLFILVKLGRKPMTAFLQARHIAIRDALEDAQKTRAEAEARFKEYSSRLDHLDRELGRLREEMKTAAQAERDRIVSEAEERGARLRREADFLLGQELKQVRKDLERELAVAAVNAAEEVLRRVTTEQDQARLAESYLQNLGSGTKEGTP